MHGSDFKLTIRLLEGLRFFPTGNKTWKFFELINMEVRLRCSSGLSRLSSIRVREEVYDQSKYCGAVDSQMKDAIFFLRHAD